MQTTSNARTYEEHFAWVMAAPDYFTACKFRGRGHYDRATATTLEGARSAAKLMSSTGVMVYAVRGQNSVYVETVS